MASQQPVFRSSVDLVAVEVQVLDRSGEPLPSLGPEKFEVTIEGKRRRVVSADFVRYAPSYNGLPDRFQAGPSDPVAAGGPGRVYIIAIDLASFSVGQSRGVV